MERQILNPMWDDVRDCALFEPIDWHQALSDDLAYNSGAWKKRRWATVLYAWAISDPESIDFVAEHARGRLVEMAAGVGYWAWMLSQSEVDVLAYDAHPPDEDTENHWHSPRDQDGNFTHERTKTWYPVARGLVPTLSHHSDRTLFLCWPPYGDDMAYQCLRFYRGDRLIYIGEPYGGCTGNDDFFHELDTHWNVAADHRIAQWFGIHDHITVYDRRTA